MIQAKYDQTPGTPFDITVDDRGMQQGVNANYWVGTKRYPNGYWADFTLTPEGKKVLKLATGGDVIQWRPDSPSDSHFAIVVVPLVPSHLKARDLGDVQNLGDNKTVMFTEDVTLDGMPDALQEHRAQPRQQIEHEAHGYLYAGQWSLEPEIDRMRQANLADRLA